MGKDDFRNNTAFGRAAEHDQLRLTFPRGCGSFPRSLTQAASAGAALLQATGDP